METLKSIADRRSAVSSAAALVSARDSKGKFARQGETEAKSTPGARVAKKRMRTERDYMRRIVQEFTEDDIAAIIDSIKRDATGDDDCDVKVVNAAREWVGKYLLGNARVPLSDVDDMPAIIKRR